MNSWYITEIEVKEQQRRFEDRIQQDALVREAYPARTTHSLVHRLLQFLSIHREQPPVRVAPPRVA